MGLGVRQRDRSRRGMVLASERGDMPEGVFVHDKGLCESESVGSGTRVWASAHVLLGAVVGRDCNICDGAYVEGGAVVGDRVTVKNQVMIFEGVTIEDDAFLGPGVIFTNDVKHGDALDRTTVRRGATLGAGVVVVCGTTIGEYAFASAGVGVVATRNGSPHSFVVDNLAGASGVSECGRRPPGGPHTPRRLPGWSHVDSFLSRRIRRTRSTLSALWGIAASGGARDGVICRVAGNVTGITFLRRFSGAESRLAVHKTSSFGRRAHRTIHGRWSLAPASVAVATWPTSIGSQK